MDRTVRSPQKHTFRGFTSVAVAFFAVACVAVGVLISAGFDLSPQSAAQPPAGAGDFSVYPVVERNGELESPFVAVVERVQDAVVNIAARSQEQDLPWWHQRAGLATSSGSGFFFRKDGYILTNNHVVANALELTVRTADGFEYEAKLVGADSATDLAVIKVEPEHDATVIPFGDSDKLKVGDWAIAIGNPFPQQGLDRTVTVGVISAIGRSQLNFGLGETPEYQYYIQTDASINPGNSGGPLLNLRGECVGVNAAISSPTGGSVGIGFAIPINLARAVVPDLIELGRAQRGWLGVWLANVTEREAKRQGLDAVRGVRIDSVFSGSPAERAGIRSGDIILKFNGREVNNASQLSVLVSTVRSGDQVDVELVRNGARQTVRTAIGDRDSYLASAETAPAPAEGYDLYRWLGMELLTFTPEIAAAVSVEHVPGVYVGRVYPGSPADQASITRGTIILQVNNEVVKALDDVEKIARGLAGTRQRVPLIVQEPDGSITRKVLRP